MVVFNPLIAPSVEERYCAQVPEAHRKQYAQFFTPPAIADFMVSWVLGIQPRSLLEPALGLGIFSRLIMQNEEYKDLPIRAFEIDPQILAWSKKLFAAYPNLDIQHDDYMYNDWSKRYDGIVCNPPYMKFHDYQNHDVVKEVEYQSGIKFRKTSNLYTMFLVKSVMQLAEGGRASYIVPTEFLNSDYGIGIKKFLLESKVLRYIFVIDSNCMTFANTLTTSTILLLQNDLSTDTVALTSISEPSKLHDYQSIINSNIYSPDMLCLQGKYMDHKAKWSEYYRPQNQGKRAHVKLVPFTQYARVKRGIATGDNDYFTFNKSKAATYQIPESCLIPCVTKAQDVSSHVFTQYDFEKLVSRDKRVYLFDASKDTNSYVDSYIELGVSLDVHRKYLTSKRNPWYALENRPPSDLWIGVFNRSKPKFIFNDAQVRNLTTFHCVYLNSHIKEDRLLLVAYLLSDISITMLESCKREYGNGLKKLEPNDINNSLIPDISSIETTTKQEIINLLSHYLLTVKHNTPQASLLEQVNTLFYDALHIHSNSANA